jgi:hypothetical protein
MGIEDYSTTPGSNTAINGISIAEGMSPANVNNAIRQMMADLAVPARSGFAAYVGTTVTDQTGDATAYVIIPNTELFDVGSNYDTTTGKYTAPADGYYFFTVIIGLAGVLAGHTRFLGSLQVEAGSGASTHARIYERDSGDLAPDGNTRVSMSFTALVQMVAGNTAKMTILVDGVGGKVVDVFAGNPPTNIATMFAGFMQAPA